MKVYFMTYSLITILFENTNAELYRFTFGDPYARIKNLIYEVTETTKIPLQVLNVQLVVPEDQEVTFVVVEIRCGGEPPKVRFDTQRLKVNIRYDWWQVQEIYKYRVTAYGKAVDEKSEEPNIEEVTQEEN